MVWDLDSGVVGDPAKVRMVDHRGRYFKVRGPLNTPPSPQGRPVLVQAGGSPRGIRAAATIVDMAFAADMALELQVRQRAAFDRALTALGRDPASVGIVWQQPVVVAETEAAAVAQRERLLTAIPHEGAGAYLSHNSGYDFATLPQWFTLGELHERIIASNASPVGFVHEMALRFGRDTPISRDDFFDYGLRVATGYQTTIAGNAAQVADRLERRCSRRPAAVAASCWAAPSRCPRT